MSSLAISVRQALARLLRPLVRPMLFVVSWLLIVTAGTVCFGSGAPIRFDEGVAFASSFGVAVATSGCVALLLAGQRRMAREGALSLVTPIVVCAGTVYSLFWLNPLLVRGFIGYFWYRGLLSFHEHFPPLLIKLFGPIGMILGAASGLLGGGLIRMFRTRPRSAVAIAVGVLFACACGPVFPAVSRLLTNWVVAARLAHANAANVREIEIAAALGGAAGAIVGATGAWILARACAGGHRSRELNASDQERMAASVLRMEARRQ
jgi:hypothetical protein